MTIKECYIKMGGNYEDVLRRLTNDILIKRFLTKFIEDQSHAGLCSAFQAGDGEESFRQAHTLKGVAMNLGLTALAESASELTELLRGGVITDQAFKSFKKMGQNYDNTIQCIRELISQ